MCESCSELQQRNSATLYKRSNITFYSVTVIVCHWLCDWKRDV